MARCLRCGAGNEFIEGKVLTEPPVDPVAWIVTKGNVTLHFSKMDGWNVEVVETMST